MISIDRLTPSLIAPPLPPNSNNNDNRYLSDVTKGGETYFPLYGQQHARSNRLTDCDSLTGGLRSPPKEGRVIMFYSLLPNGDVDDKSLHGSCAVKQGVKWAANKWVWNTPRF